MLMCVFLLILSMMISLFLRGRQKKVVFRGEVIERVLMSFGNMNMRDFREMFNHDSDKNCMSLSHKKLAQNT